MFFDTEKNYYIYLIFTRKELKSLVLLITKINNIK